jgi:hypothetical protein
MSNSKLSVFLLNLRIGDGLPGGISCTLDLGVSPENNATQGRSVIFQAVNPITHVQSAVTGTYNYLCTNTSCHIMLVLNGFTENEGGSLKNFEARILLTDDWKTGTADYSFLNNGEWVAMTNQKVESVSDDGINDLGKLAETVKLANA